MELLVNFMNNYIINDITFVCIQYLSEFDKYLMKFTDQLTENITEEEKNEFLKSINHTSINVYMFKDFLLNKTMINDDLTFICKIYEHLYIDDFFTPNIIIRSESHREMIT